jgi:hypothetical protein
VLLPDVLVVTAKQLRSEIMVDVAQVRMTWCCMTRYMTCYSCMICAAAGCVGGDGEAAAQ